MTLPKVARGSSADLYRRRIWDNDLRTVRRDLGLSMRDVAGVVGISIGAYWQIEHGGDPMLVNALAISELFGEKVETLWAKRIPGKAKTPKGKVQS